MNMPIKKVLSIQDMSSIGRCSLTVVIPVLSVMGIQCVPMPTAVLSTHFGGFGSVARQDLTGFCYNTLKEFIRIGINFECIYSGFIANNEQIELVKDAYRQFESAIKLCDPVMADNGKMYSSITNEIVEGIKEICKSSDIITPNTTEANILLDRDMNNLDYSQDDICNMTRQLSDIYDCTAIITGAKVRENRVICCIVKKKDKKPVVIECNYLPVHFPGTGDLFCATMIAEYINCREIKQAVEKASRFVEICVRNTYGKNVDARFGVDLELNLKYLIHNYDAEKLME